MDPADSVQPSGSFLTPLLISLAGVVASSLAIVTYHMFLAKYCTRRGDQDQNAIDPSSTVTDQNGGEFATGVEPKILEAISILSFSREKLKDFHTDQTECVVCLGELEEGEDVRLLPNCRHVFHVSCIDNWFLAHSSCPVCRTLVDTTTDCSLTSPSHAGDDSGERELQDVHQNICQGCDPVPASAPAPSNSGIQPNTMLRHCVSLVFPTETKQDHLITGLKRSLSLDQSYVLINLTEESEKSSSTSSSSPASSSSSSSSTSSRILTKSQSYKARSIKQFDRMSTLLRSFSQLRNGRSSTNYGILPY